MLKGIRDTNPGRTRVILPRSYNCSTGNFKTIARNSVKLDCCTYLVVFTSSHETRSFYRKRHSAHTAHTAHTPWDLRMNTKNETKKRSFWCKILQRARANGAHANYATTSPARAMHFFPDFFSVLILTVKVRASLLMSKTNARKTKKISCCCCIVEASKTLFGEVFVEIWRFECSEMPSDLLNHFKHTPVSYTHLTLPTICSV